MKKTVLLYGFLLAILTGIMKFVEYRFLIRDLSIEFYIGAVALFFTSLGVWVGVKLTQKKKTESDQSSPISIKDNTNIDAALNQYGISKREYEVLTLIAKGYSNKEIAESLYLSLNTVKSHSSNLFQKLDVKRRTQAVQKGVELGILSKFGLTD